MASSTRRSRELSAHCRAEEVPFVTSIENHSGMPGAYARMQPESIDPTPSSGSRWLTVTVSPDPSRWQTLAVSPSYDLLAPSVVEMRGRTNVLPTRPCTTVLWAHGAQIFVDQQIGQNQGSPTACAIPKNARQLIIWILSLRGTKERSSECERISQPDWFAHRQNATAAPRDPDRRAECPPIGTFRISRFYRAVLAIRILRA
jgi:hypothetical protein